MCLQSYDVVTNSILCAFTIIVAIYQAKMLRTDAEIVAYEIKATCTLSVACILVDKKAICIDFHSHARTLIESRCAL